MREMRNKRERQKRITKMHHPRGPTSATALGGTGSETQNTAMSSHDWPNCWVCDGAGVVVMLHAGWSTLQWRGGTARRKEARGGAAVEQSKARESVKANEGS
jgi:hypothetical protein